MTHRAEEAGAQPAIPDDNAPLPPARRPTRWNVRRGRAIALILVGLALAASLASVYLTYEAAQESAAQAAAVDRRLSVLEDDLAERTRQRDAERDAAAARAAQDREQFRARFCEVLTELSATFPNLNQLRGALGCATAAPAARRPATPTGPPDNGMTATGAPRPSAPAPAPARPSPAPAPTPAPPAEPPDGPGLICGALPLLCPPTEGEPS